MGGWFEEHSDFIQYDRTCGGPVTQENTTRPARGRRNKKKKNLVVVPESPGEGEGFIRWLDPDLTLRV